VNANNICSALEMALKLTRWHTHTTIMHHLITLT
jgi:hypothetical protein